MVKLCCICHKEPRIPDNSYCLKCVRDYRRKRNQILKRWAVDKLGRKCLRCGLISEHDCAYDFHHKNGNGWSRNDGTSSNLRMKELLKWRKEDKIPEDVFLICAVCHRIEEEQDI